MFDHHNRRVAEVANLHIAEVALHRDDTIVALRRIVTTEAPRIVAALPAARPLIVHLLHQVEVRAHPTRVVAIRVADSFNA